MSPVDPSMRDKQRYIQGYLMVVNNIYGRGHFTAEQGRLAEEAYKKRLPPSGFVLMIRKQDPAYAQSKEFHVRAQEAKSTWKRYKPGRPVANEFLSNYVHSGLNKAQLHLNIEAGMKRKNAKVPRRGNEEAYRGIRTLLNDAFQSRLGKDAHPRLHDFIFSKKVQEAHIEEGFQDLFGGKEKFGFMDPDTGKSNMQKEFEAFR